MHYNKRTVAQRYVSKKNEALSTQYFLTIKFKTHCKIKFQKDQGTNLILPFKKNILAQFLIINKCSLHEVLFERKAEITLIIPDLDNASEGRENTRLRVTPELFRTMQNSIRLCCHCEK